MEVRVYVASTISIKHKYNYYRQVTKLTTWLSPWPAYKSRGGHMWYDHVDWLWVNEFIEQMIITLGVKIMTILILIITSYCYPYGPYCNANWC